jgi:hypothetical protein
LGLKVDTLYPSSLNRRIPSTQVAGGASYTARSEAPTFLLVARLESKAPSMRALDVPSHLQRRFSLGRPVETTTRIRLCVARRNMWVVVDFVAVAEQTHQCANHWYGKETEECPHAWRVPLVRCALRRASSFSCIYMQGMTVCWRDGESCSVCPLPPQVSSLPYDWKVIHTLSTPSASNSRTSLCFKK